MTQSIITKVKNGKVVLPRNLQKQWDQREVMVFPSTDGLYIKPITRPSLAALKPKLKKLGKMISSAEIEDAVRWARQKTHAGRP